MNTGSTGRHFSLFAAVAGLVLAQIQHRVWTLGKRAAAACIGEQVLAFAQSPGRGTVLNER
jgi:hypothetical protein